MNQVLNFIIEFRFIIIAVIVIALYAWFDWKDFKVQALKTMLSAKKWAKDSAQKGIIVEGLEQEDWVIDCLLKAAGKFSWTRFLNDQTKRSVIRKLYEDSLDLLDDGKLNGSIYKLEPAPTANPVAPNPPNVVADSISDTNNTITQAGTETAQNASDTVAATTTEAPAPAPTEEAPTPAAQ